MADIQKDSYDESKQYRKLIFQQGRLPMEFEWNELQDILWYLFRRSNKDQIGDAFISGSGGLVETTGNANEIVVRSGSNRFYADGVQHKILADITESTPVPPGSGTRTDGVWLHIFWTEIGEVQDPNIVSAALAAANPNAETARRHRQDVEVVFDEGDASPFTSTDTDAYIKVATIERTAGQDVIAPGDITDVRDMFGTQETNADNILQLANDLYTAPSLDDDGNPNLGTPLETQISDHLADAADAHDASAISYDNATSGLAATEVQSAIDELDAALDAVSCPETFQDEIQDLQPSEQSVPDDTIQVRRGRWSFGDQSYSFGSAQNSPTISPVSAAGQERYDLLHIDPSSPSGMTLEQGVEDTVGNASIPDYTGKLPIAGVYVDEDTTVVVDNADITDLRPFLLYQSPTVLLGMLKTVDGSGSGLDADLLDGKDYSDLQDEFTSITSLSNLKVQPRDPVDNMVSMLSGWYDKATSRVPHGRTEIVQAELGPFSPVSGGGLERIDAVVLTGSTPSIISGAEASTGTATPPTWGVNQVPLAFIYIDESGAVSIGASDITDARPFLKIFTASELLNSLKTVDGSGSGLDADLLDGLEGADYLDLDKKHDLLVEPYPSNPARVNVRAGRGNFHQLLREVGVQQSSTFAAVGAAGNKRKDLLALAPDGSLEIIEGEEVGSASTAPSPYHAGRLPLAEVLIDETGAADIDADDIAPARPYFRQSAVLRPLAVEPQFGTDLPAGQWVQLALVPPNYYWNTLSGRFQLYGDMRDDGIAECLLRVRDASTGHQIEFAGRHNSRPVPRTAGGDWEQDVVSAWFEVVFDNVGRMVLVWNQVVVMSGTNWTPLKHANISNSYPVEFFHPSPSYVSRAALGRDFEIDTSAGQIRRASNTRLSDPSVGLVVYAFRPFNNRRLWEEGSAGSPAGGVNINRGNVLRVDAWVDSSATPRAWNASIWGA